jgi:hypothetical protein
VNFSKALRDDIIRKHSGYYVDVHGPVSDDSYVEVVNEAEGGVTKCF